MSDLRAGPERTLLEEERDFFLRSLRDLDAERAAGDIDDVDYRALRSDYTARAAQVLRRLEALAAPLPTAAAPESVPAAAPENVPAAGVASAGRPGPPAGAAEPPGRARWWRQRRALIAAAVIAALGAAGIGWAITAASGSRLPGGVVSGQAVGQEQVAKLLLAAQQATARGDGVTALKDLEAVLKQDPNQVEALSSEGWILAQTQQPQLLAQGIGLLTRAERLDPSYPPTHVYRGVAYLSEGDDAAAIPDLQWYLAHDPDPGLVGRVRQALAQAQAQVRAGAGRSAPGTTTPPKG